MKTKTKTENIQLNTYGLKVKVVKLSEQPDIHKLHHRAEFEEYMPQFSCEEDTIFFHRKRAVLVLHRKAGRLMISGQYDRWGDNNATLYPLVAYCDWQGVSRDFFIKENEGLSAVERQHRDSLVSRALLYSQIKRLEKAMGAFVENRMPLSSAEALSIAGPSLSALRGFYKMFNRYVPQIHPIDGRIESAEKETLNSMVRARHPLTKAGSRVAFFNKLERGTENSTANQTITSWEGDKIRFSSGIQVPLSPDDVRAFLSGSLTNLGTRYGDIYTSGSTIVCGCHRIAISEVCKRLGIPEPSKVDEENLPDHLAEIKQAFDSIRSYRADELKQAREAFSKAETEKLDYWNNLPEEGRQTIRNSNPQEPVEREAREYRELSDAYNKARHNFFEISRDISVAKSEQRSALRQKLASASDKAREALARFLSGSDELKAAVEKNIEGIKADHEAQKKRADAVASSQNTLEEHREWLNYVSLNSNLEATRTTTTTA